MWAELEDECPLADSCDNRPSDKGPLGADHTALSGDALEENTALGLGCADCEDTNGQSPRVGEAAVLLLVLRVALLPLLSLHFCIFADELVLEVPHAAARCVSPVMNGCPRSACADGLLLGSMVKH